MYLVITASRNVAFKSGKLAGSVFTSQADVLTRQLVMEDEDSSTPSTSNLLTKAKRIFKTWVIINNNADLYIFIKTIDMIKL